jgi:hypothetical protein
MAVSNGTANAPAAAWNASSSLNLEAKRNLIDLVWLWFRSPHCELAAEMMWTSEPPH